MQNKEIQFGDSAIDAMVSGVNKLANAVKVTLGPKGRTVIIDQPGKVHVTKDGVTVAKNVKLKNKFENMGAQMVKEVASKANDEAGDGTTTATVLAQAIINEGVKAIRSGHCPVELKNGIDAAVTDATAKLSAMAKPCDTTEDIMHISSVSANNSPDIGKLIADAMDKVGKTGIITVEEGSGLTDELHVVEGLQFDRGYVSPYFASNTADGKVILEKPLIITMNKKVQAVQDIVPFMEAAVNSSSPLLIIAEDVSEEALVPIILNYTRGICKCVVVKSPAFGELRREQLGDISTLVGSQLVDDQNGISLETGMDILGTAAKVIITKDTTTIVDGAGDPAAVESRAAHIETLLLSANSDYAKAKLQERLAKLTGGVAIIKVGASTETEMREKKDRVDDALCAAKAAVEEGILPGGGLALVRVASELGSALRNLSDCSESYRAGYSAVLKSMNAPLFQICYNAAVSPELVHSKISAEADYYGYNARNGKYCDLVSEGILDPAKVTRLALTYAASVASMLLTTSCAIVDEDIEE